MERRFPQDVATPAETALPVSNPVLVEVTRGELVESFHRGAIAIASASGEMHLEIGDTTTAIYPRSAIKLIQALPLVESGAVARFGFDNKALALTCASHNGEEEHIDCARHMLEVIGLDEDALECGSHRPMLKAATARLHAHGIKPGALYNNCSGKHAGMLALAVHLGIDPKGYVRRDHRVQQNVAEVISEMTEADLVNAPCSTDGCSVPTYAIPLRALAYAFARVADPAGLGRVRAGAVRQLTSACMAEPFMVAGTGRFCTKITEAFRGKILAKTGAEGVFCACLPGRGIGISVKCVDGATRAAEIMMANVLAALVKPEDGDTAVLGGLARASQYNWNRIHVGELRPSAEFTSLLAGLA